MVFTDDFDNSGNILNGVCVSELFNFVLCSYEKYLYILHQVFYLMLINIALQSSAVVSF